MSTVYIIKDDDNTLRKVEDRLVFGTVNELHEYFYTCELSESEDVYCHEDKSLYIISRKRLLFYSKGEIVKSIEIDN